MFTPSGRHKSPVTFNISVYDSHQTEVSLPHLSFPIYDNTSYNIYSTSSRIYHTLYSIKVAEILSSLNRRRLKCVHVREIAFFKFFFLYKINPYENWFFFTMNIIHRIIRGSFIKKGVLLKQCSFLLICNVCIVWIWFIEKKLFWGY